jgi:polysaccharide biosynthesis protein PslG
MKRLAALAVLALSVMQGCGGGIGSTPQATSVSAAPATTGDTPVRVVPVTNFIVGVGTHIFANDLDLNVQKTAEMGMNSVRDDLCWEGVETSLGSLIMPDKMARYTQKLADSSISPLIILDYGNHFYDQGGKPTSPEGLAAYVNYARFSTNSLKGTTKLFEIWNEWDRSSGPNSPEAYFKLVQSAAPAIKAENSDAVVLAGAASTSAMRSGWIDKLVQAGVMDYVDGISIHPYVHCESDSRPETWVSFLQGFSDNLQRINSGREVPLYITEMGWSSDTGACGNSPEVVGKYVARAMLLARTVPSLRGLWWYDLKNDGKNPAEGEDNFGLMSYDYAPKPAFNAIKDTATLIRDGRRFVRLASQPDLVIEQIDDKSGLKTFAIWTANGRPAQVKVTFTRNDGGKLYKLSVGTGVREEITLPASGNQASLVVTDNPQLIYGAQAVSVEFLNWQ